MQMPPEFYPTQEAAGLLGVSGRLLRDHREEGSLEIGTHYLVTSGTDSKKLHIVWNVAAIRAAWSIPPYKRAPKSQIGTPR